MKRKAHLFIAGLLATTFALHAQHQFVVQNGTASVYTSLQEAYDAATAGDTIYLPGGSFEMPTVEKPLTWIGVGYHPDSTAATYHSLISSHVTFTGAADDTYITGIHFGQNLTFGSTGDDVVDAVISRCRVDGALTLKSDNGTERVTNMVISECILNGTLNGNSAANVLFEKCIVQGTFNNFHSSIFDRVIVLQGSRNYSWAYSYCFTGTTDCLVRNSIIGYHSHAGWRADVYSNENNHFANNVFGGTTTFPAGTNTGTDNLTGFGFGELFEHIEGSSTTFSYLNDYHIKAGSLALGAGTGGTDPGIYGGDDPFKVGGLPPVPHIREVNVAMETIDGQLQVEIKAAAQEN